MKLQTATLIGTLALIATACGGNGGTTIGSGPTSGPSPSAPAGPLTFPAGPERLVLRISAGLGGLMPYEYSLSAVPGLSVYGDGSAVVVGTRGVRQRTDVVTLARTAVDLGRLSSLVQAADRDGLFRPGLSLDQPNVTDLPTDEVHLYTADGRHRELSAYALDFSDHENQLPAASRRGRATLRRLLKAVDALVRSAPRRPYPPERYALMIDRASADDRPLAGVPAPWPVGDLSAARPREPTSQRCLVLDGVGAARLSQLLNDRQVTNSQTWTDGAGGGLVRVVIRPLLPDQRTCE